MYPFTGIRPLFQSLLLGAIALVAFARPAAAVPYYFEFGGTMARVSDPGPLFQTLGRSASNSAASSFGVPFTLGIHLQEAQRGLLFSFALQGRYLSGQTGAGESYSVMTTSPMLRVEFWRIVLGAGYTPYIWKDFTFTKNGGVDSAITFEAQFLFPITPEIDFGLQAAKQTFSMSSGSTSTLEYGAFFRLNFGLSTAAAGERRKFKGWRYPFGSPLR